MQPTEILMQEHRVIERVLRCLEKMADQMEAGHPADFDSARQAVDFFRNFADRCHHGKEEDCLFPLMEDRGFSRQQGPTGVMLHEHEEGRRHVRGMAQAMEAASAGEDASLREFVTHARAFIPLLREHIQKEDHCLFPMADQALSKTDQEQLLASFEKVEQEDLAATHQKYLDIADRLGDRFGVTGDDPVHSSRDE